MTAVSTPVGWKRTELVYYLELFEELLDKAVADPLKVPTIVPRLGKVVGRIEEEADRLPLRPEYDVALALVRVAECRARFDVIAASPDATSAKRLTVASLGRCDDTRSFISQCETFASDFAVCLAAAAAEEALGRFSETDGTDVPSPAIDDTLGQWRLDAQALRSVVATSAELQLKAECTQRSLRTLGQQHAGRGVAGALGGVTEDAVLFFLVAFEEALKQLMGMAGGVPSGAAEPAHASSKARPPAHSHTDVGTAPPPGTSSRRESSSNVVHSAAAAPTTSNMSSQVTRGSTTSQPQPPASTVRSESKPQGTPATDAPRRAASQRPSASTPTGELDGDNVVGGGPISRLEYPGHDMPYADVEALLNRFYLFHNPEKLSDVPLIVKGYLGRGTTQQRLFAELNKKYPTADKPRDVPSASASTTDGAAAPSASTTSAASGPSSDDQGGCVVQ